MTAAIEQPTSDPQASIRKLHEDLRFANTLLSSVRIERDELKQQLAECWAERDRYRAVCEKLRDSFTEDEQLEATDMAEAALEPTK